ncbi:MAG: hypothetical protein E6J91_00055 [Deltaproteobacteria bacterium]|nr:MAG: hypothetical protein E6J91_00055 [Deltaproteobacteria bacterium]
MLVRMIAGIMVMLGVSAAGCGGGDGGITPREACEDSQANLCERIYACYTPEELAGLGFPGNEAACVTMLQASQGCARQTAENTYADQANTCVAQITGLACSQVRDPNLSLNAAAPACGKICAIP